MFAKTWFWGAFATLAALAALVAWRGFSAAFPLVDLDVAMSRSQALEGARELAEELGCGPANARSAARFGLDARQQTFLELEGGGPARVRDLLASGEPALHAWRVRLFEPGERGEATIAFTPGGEPWGFDEILADETPGAALDPDEARALALRALGASPFRIDLDEWEDVERARELRSSGRVDHAFTWRHRRIRFGDGEYRLRLRVSGDRLTAVTRWIEVPEAFDRRHAEMRSINETIAAAGSAGLSAFFLAGLGASLLVLLRRRWLLVKPAFLWGFAIGGLQGLAILNAWPLAWFSYDTALSPRTFAWLQVLQALGATLGVGLLLGLTFVAAEGLARRAFPGHPRLWSLWSKDAASTRSVLGMTLAGYFLVAGFFAYEVALSLLATRVLGWWSPIGALQDPDAFATWFPWLDAVATSLQAGFWEEALFRAIPLSLAVLVGRHWGRERAVVLSVLVLQAVVFGAAHAAYPAQPAFARLVELTLPAIGFGLLFLRFGLLACVICHAVYDLLWIALPIVHSSSAGAGVQSLVVGGVAAAPLLVVLAARARRGRWAELEPEQLNGTWRPPARPPRESPLPAVPPPLAAGAAWTLGALGLLGLGLFLAFGRFESDAPPLGVPRSEALDRARGELKSRGLELSSDWRELSSVDASPSDEVELAWRELGPAGFRDFVRDWSGEPEWTVRFVRASGDVVARAEEWRVAVTASGHARVRHVLPASSPGPRLGESTARALASTELHRRLGLAAAELEEVEARPERLPERTDWRFAFRAPAAWSGRVGEARAFVEIAGSEPVRVGRFVEVPEDWLRVERERRLLLTVPSAISLALLALVVVGTCLAALVAWSAGRFRAAPAAFAFAVVALSGLVDAWNSWPQAVAAFSTERSWELQGGLALGGLCATALALGWAASLLVGLAEGWRCPATGGPAWRGPLAGLGLGVLFGGLQAGAGAFAERFSPAWGSFTAAGSRLPWLTEALAGLPLLVAGTAVLLVLVQAFERLTGGWSRRRTLGRLLLALLGCCVGLGIGWDSAAGLLVAALTGLAMGPPLALVLRRAPEATPCLLAGWLALGRILSAAQGVHPDQALGASLSAALLLAAGLCWSRRLGRLNH